MNIQKELLKTTRVYSGSAEPGPERGAATTPVYFRQIQEPHRPVKSVSLRELLAAKMQKPGFAERFSEATKRLGEAYYKDEKSIRALRLAKGITQTQLAALAETSQPQIYKLEQGESDFRASSVAKLASIFEISKGEMFEIMLNDQKRHKDDI